ncbi:MAG: TRAP transporter small permease [Desulfobacteraceae bacterium]|nr:MAG: TRAP transporter small permease [Desulfobacteraceae bacterium]
MKRFLDIFDRTLNVMTFLAGILLVFIMLSVCLEVILRSFINRPQIWVTEVTECLLLYITFLGTAWLLREEGHVKVDIVLNRLKPQTTAFLGIISSIMGVLVSITLTIYGFNVTWDYFQRGIYTPTALEIPVYLILLIIPIGSLMLFIQFIRRTGKFVAGFIIEMGKSRT